MKIKIRTGIFEMQIFNLAVENQKILMRNAENQIIIPLKDIQKIQIISEPSHPARIILNMNAQLLEGIFFMREDVEIFVNELRKQDENTIINIEPAQ